MDKKTIKGIRLLQGKLDVAPWVVPQVIAAPLLKVSLRVLASHCATSLFIRDFHAHVAEHPDQLESPDGERLFVLPGDGDLDEHDKSLPRRQCDVKKKVHWTDSLLPLSRSPSSVRIDHEISRRLVV